MTVPLTETMTEPIRPAVLLLGASGFLGHQIAAALKSAGLSVMPISGVDLCAVSEAQWDEWASGVQAIMNAAGRTGGSLTELTRSNTLLLARVLEVAQRHSLRLIHLASAAEYGRTPEGHASREDDPAQPLSAYGASKLAGTVLLEEAVRSGRADAVALRLTNPIGAGMNASSLPGRAARELRTAAQIGQAEVRFGPLGAMRDFVAAGDVTRAVLHCLPGQPGQSLTGVVNLGSGEAVPVRSVVTILAELAGFIGTIQEDSPGSPRSSDVPYQRADISRLQQSGFVSQRSLREALTELYQA